MIDRYQLYFWGGLSLLLVLILWGLQDIMLPFILGFAIAYFLDPVVDRVEGKGLGRGISTGIVLLGFIFLFGAGLAWLLPILKAQLSQFIGAVPDYIEMLKATFLPWVEKSSAQFLPNGGVAELQDEYAGKALGWASDLLQGIWEHGLALFDILSILIITPVVAFYLLRDWDLLVEEVDDCLPRQQQKTIRQLFKEINVTLAGFVRGQASVCFLLGIFYAVALTLADLKYGIFIGLLAGIISFIPYVGASVGMIVALVAGWFQFGLGTEMVVVATIFIVGQFFEGNVLTPKLVGDRIGLHAVWVLFALMAGGSLLGFVGVMIAVPVAAVIGVMVRFLLELYLQSGYYHGKAKKK